MKIGKRIEALRDSIKLWEYLAESGDNEKWTPLATLGIDPGIKNGCPLCQAVSEEVDKEGGCFYDNMGDHCQRHCPMSISDWYRQAPSDINDTIVLNRPACEAFDKGSLWQNWANAPDDQSRKKAAAEMAAAFKAKFVELMAKLRLEIGELLDIEPNPLGFLARSRELPAKHRLEYQLQWLRTHGSELRGGDAVFALREVFGVGIGDTIRVSYYDPTKKPYAIPCLAKRTDNPYEATTIYTVSRIKGKYMYINGNFRKGRGYCGTLEAGLFHFFVDADQIEKVTTTSVVKPAVVVMQELVYQGYTCDKDGVWSCSGHKVNFVPSMWFYCGKPSADSEYCWEPEWLDTEQTYTTIYTRESGVKV